MIKSIKTWILVGFASLLLVACGQSGGGAGSKKSKTLENTKKAGFVKWWSIKKRKLFIKL